MSDIKLLDINPDKLFEELSVDQIKSIQNKLQAENERKRVELRTLVGEGYRDLIEAADTISDMRVTAEGVIGHIEKMSNKCQELQHQHLIGYSLDSKKCPNKKATNDNASAYYGIAVQIKILMDVPEQIWCAIEKDDFMLGSLLFLFSRHINTGLQLHTGNDVANNVTKWFPVVLRQWNTISHFQEAIFKRCQVKLQSHSLTDEDASSCLSVLILLKSIGSLELLDTFLQLRTTAIEKVLNSEQHTTGGVRSRICTSLQLLMHSITILHACFIGNSTNQETIPEGLVWKQLKSVAGRDSAPTISLLDMSNVIAAKYLPVNIQDFRPSMVERVNPVPPGVMREKVTEWLANMEKFIEKQVSSRLLGVATVRGLQAIREEASSIVNPSNHWDLICQQLMIPRGLNLWETYYQAILTKRVKDIVKQNWNSILDQLIATLSQTINKLHNEKSSREQPEHDLRWFTWSEWSSDLPQSDAKVNQPKVLGLSMKAKGFSPRVEKLCTDFDEQLKALLIDLQHYLGNEDHLDLLMTTNENKFIDKSEVQLHLQTCTMESITRLVEYTRSESLKQNTESCTILLARFLQAIPDLCSNLQKCLSSGGPLKEMVHWQELINILRRESLSTWQLWQASVSVRFLALIEEKLSKSNRSSDLLQTMPQWDVVSIEEKGEEGLSVKSDIRVPSQPSLPLQELLNSACYEINAIVPHTLLTSIHQELILNFVQGIFNYYDALVSSNGITQTHALQMSLDVKYLTTLLVPRDNKVLMGRSQEINDKIEDKVDPFDLDVFTPYIQTNIKRSVQRSQCLLGVLIAWPEKLASGTRPTAAHSTEDPNVLPLSSGSPWFQLLPVAGPPGHRTTLTAQQRSTSIKQPKTTPNFKPKLEAASGDIRSSAAAFFGAMSTDWFGS